MSHSGRIENALTKLNALGWTCEVHNFKIPQFSMHVDYDNKRLAINCPKAYHTAQMLDHVHDITTVETESLSGQKCVVRGAYVYSFVGLEVFEYTSPNSGDHKAFANLVLTGMPRSMYTGEFFPESEDRAVMHIEVEGDVNVQTLDAVVAAVQNATGYVREKPTIPGRYNVRHIAKEGQPEFIGEEVNVWLVEGVPYVDLDPDGSCPVSSVHDGLEWQLIEKADSPVAEDVQVSVCVRRSDSTIVTADDAPGNGGAHHEYSISTVHDPELNSSFKIAVLRFQNGGVAEVGVNGIQIEDLLAMSAHRLECFQAGPFACIQNQSALESIKHALATLDARTADRKARNVEGKQVV